MSAPIKAPAESEDAFAFHTYRATKRGPGTDDDRLCDVVVPVVVQELRGHVEDIETLASVSYEYDADVLRETARRLTRRADELQAWLDVRDKERAS